MFFSSLIEINHCVLFRHNIIRHTYRHFKYVKSKGKKKEGKCLCTNQMFHMSMIVLALNLFNHYLNIRPEAIKFLEGKICKRLFDIGLNNNYFGHDSKRTNHKSKNKQEGL